MAKQILRDRIVQYIAQNRISTVEIADSLNKTGVLEGFSALNPGHFAVGPVYYAYAHGESNWSVHEQVQRAPADSIVYIDAFDCGRRAIFGDLVAKYILLYRKARAVVVNGTVRDAHRLRKENYPIWCTGATPLGCFNRDVPLTADVRRRAEARRQELEGSIIVADDSGCTMIASSLMNEGLFKKLEWIERQEDIWYFCLDTLKMSTYETVCLKRYLSERKRLPRQLDSILRDLEKISREIRA